MCDERDDVLAPRAKGWDRNFQSDEAEAQIGTEAVFLNKSFEVGVSGRNDSGV